MIQELEVVQEAGARRRLGGAVGSVVQDEAGEDDRGQTVNLNCILQAMGSLWRILITRAELFKKISLVICMSNRSKG